MMVRSIGKKPFQGANSSLNLEILKKFNIKENYSLDEGLDETINWFKKLYKKLENKLKLFFILNGSEIKYRWQKYRNNLALPSCKIICLKKFKKLPTIMEW